MMTFELLIVFANGLQKTIDDVSDYEIRNDKMFIFEKNGNRNFIPAENVLYFGRKCDYEDF